jgi:RNA polymerase sigma factor (sigma-70 family)
MDLTDNQIMLAVKAGATEQFGILFERHHEALFAFFYRMTGEKTASEDLVQEAFLRMFRYRGTFRVDSQFRAWMYQIARNVRIDDVRRGKPPAPLPLNEIRDHGSPSWPGWKSQIEEQEVLLECALLALPEQKREVLVLACYQGMKHEEIAALLGIEAGAVKVRVHRAMKQLREIFLKMSGEKSKCDVKKSVNILPII